MHGPRILVLDDGELADQVRSTLPAEPAPGIVGCGDVAVLPDLFRTGATFHVVVAGPMMSDPDGIARLQVIGEELPEISIVLAFESRPDVAIRDLVRVGSVDLLTLPVDDIALGEALARAVAMAREPASGSSPPTQTAPAEPPPRPATDTGDDELRERPRSTIVTVLSATGAAGRTSVAINLASHLADLGHRVGLVDLDLVFGDAAARLGVAPETSVATVLGDRGEHLELLSHAVEARPGLWLLAAPCDPACVEVVDRSAVDRILDTAAAVWDVVVVDTTLALAEATLTAVDRSERLVVVSLADAASLRDLRALLDRLRRQRVPAERIRLILNRVVDGDEQPVDGAAGVPESDEVARAESRGEPVLASAPRAAVSQALTEAFASLVPAVPPALATPRRAIKLRRRRQ